MQIKLGKNIDPIALKQNADHARKMNSVYNGFEKIDLSALFATQNMMTEDLNGEMVPYDAFQPAYFSGLPKIDDELGGLAYASLTLVLGDKGTGKSSFVKSVCRANTTALNNKAEFFKAPLIGEPIEGFSDHLVIQKKNDPAVNIDCSINYNKASFDYPIGQYARLRALKRAMAMYKGVNRQPCGILTYTITPHNPFVPHDLASLFDNIIVLEKLDYPMSKLSFVKCQHGNAPKPLYIGFNDFGCYQV